MPGKALADVPHGRVRAAHVFPLAKPLSPMLRFSMMDSRHNGPHLALAPFAHNALETRSPSRAESRAEPRAESRSNAFPPVDEHIVVPETSRIELLDGREITDMGAHPPHADAQALLGFLLAAHVHRAYVVATELLTRSSIDSDFASDVSIRKRGIDPETGSRYLEELSFEIVNEQSMSDVIAKAKNLARRGVRRIFAIFVKKGELREWSRAKGEFVRLDATAMFDDEVFVRPIAIKALVDSTLTEAENEVAKALWEKKTPEIMRIQQEGVDTGRNQGHKEGHKKGLDEGQLNGRRETLVEQLAERFDHVPGELEKRIRAANLEQLRAWSKRLLTSPSLDDVFA